MDSSKGDGINVDAGVVIQKLQAKLAEALTTIVILETQVETLREELKGLREKRGLDSE